MPAHQLFHQLLERIERQAESHHDPLVVLDLDGTLYNGNPRTLRILQEFAHQHARRYPELAREIDRLSVADLAYRVRDTLTGAGVRDPGAIAAVEAFWFERFFTNEYVVYDLPTPGAVEFVRAIHAAGAVPTYLTGRDAPNMLMGTVRSLQRDGFPVGTVDTRLVLKDAFETPDEPYKRSIIKHLQATGEVVGVFDNEPGLCNLFREAFPEAVVVWLDTVCAPGSPPLAEGVATLTDFLEMSEVD